MPRDWHNEAAALWLAPLAATVPLLPFLSIPSSPFFMGRLMDDPTHPMNWSHLGPLISAMAVIFDAQLLGFLVVVLLVTPCYLALRDRSRNSTRNILMLCAAAGSAASQLARMISHGFRQADLRAFANSGVSPILGCLCGLAAGAFISYFADRRIARPLVCCAPVAASGICAIVLIWSSVVWHAS